MAKKNATPALPQQNPDNIIQTPMEDVLHNAMIPYAEHVILERALPRVEDGLKPVQRRILFTMLELNNIPDKPHRKCARIVGDCLGKFHPHGDSSVYDALVRMAQDFSMRAPLVDGHGNFGSMDGDSAAAMRYTEARMTTLAMEMLRDIDKDTVPFRLNFDDTLKEPVVLPARFPNLLVNGASGIAVGLATNIPPHNLGEAIQAVKAVMEDPDIPLNRLMEYLPAPDFPTGGVLVRNEELVNAYETGRGKLTLRARVHLEDGAAGRKLICITEVPYQVNKAAMLEKILRLSEEKKSLLGGIYDIRDESDRTGLRAVIEVKRDADVDRILAALYRYSDMQMTFGVNMVAIAGGKPVQMGIKEMIGHFIAHQKDVVTRRTQYELDQARRRAHILQGLMVAVDNLDEVIALIRSSKNPAEARARLVERFALSEEQAQAILDMRLQRLTNLEILALRREYEELQQRIAYLEGILSSEKKLLKVICREMEEIGKAHVSPRMTTLEEPEEKAVDLTEAPPPPEDAVVAYTYGGQFKRMSKTAFARSPLPVREEDALEAARYLFQTKTDETLLLFTSHGNCYPLAVSALTEVAPKERGQLPTALLAGWEEEEALLHLWCGAAVSLAEAPDVLFFTSGGMVKRSKAADYQVRSKKFSALTLKEGDQLLDVCMVQGEDDLLLISRQGMSIRFPLDSVPAQGRIAAGVKAIQLEQGDQVMFAAQLLPQGEVVLITDRGYGKRIPQMDFEQQNRNGKGMKAFYFNKSRSNGECLAGVVQLKESPATLTIHQTRSPDTRLSSGEIAYQGKTGKGVPCVMAILDDVVTGMEG